MRRPPVYLFVVMLPFWSNYLIRTYAWIGMLNREGLIQDEPESDETPPALTREPMELPAGRPRRLQPLPRGDEERLLGMH